MKPAIKMTEEKLNILSSAPETIELYKAREYSAHERANLVSTGIERGKIEEKIEEKIEGKMEVAIALLDVLDDEMIAVKTGIEIGKIKELRDKHSK